MGAQIVNELTGEMVLTDDAEHAYHLVFDLTAVMAVEQMSGRQAMDILASRPSVTDCVCMIVAGVAGYQRRHPGGKKVSPTLAQRILIDSGGLLRLAPVLAESMSCAEGLGLGPDESSEDGDGDDPAPFASPTS